VYLSSLPRPTGNHPIVIRIFEVVKSTDKKKKDSQLTEIARARLDLEPLLQGKVCQRCCSLHVHDR
jgi:hypothetical protein